MSKNLHTMINGTSSCYNLTAEKTAKTVAFCLIFPGSQAGNTDIGIIVYKTKTMRKPINFLVVNKAMSDLLLSIFSMPLSIQEIYTDYFLIVGPLGQFLCKLAYFLPLVSGLVSTQSLVLIAVDRFRAVVFPLRPPLIRSKLCPYVIVSTWLVLTVMSTPAFFTKTYVYTGKLKCEWRSKESFVNYYSYAMPIVICAISFLLIIILYSIILFKLKSQKIPGEQLANVGRQRQQREENALKMVIAIVLGFAVCWLPYSIVFFLHVFASDIGSCGFEYFVSFALLMVRINCAINPCICFISSRNYRIGLKTLF